MKRVSFVAVIALFALTLGGSGALAAAPKNQSVKVAAQQVVKKKVVKKVIKKKVKKAVKKIVAPVKKKVETVKKNGNGVTKTVAAPQEKKVEKKEEAPAYPTLDKAVEDTATAGYTY